MTEPSIPTLPDPTGLLLPARVTMILAATVVTVGMTPCLGFLQWPGMLLCLPPLVLGSLGLHRVKRQRHDEQLRPAPFLGAVVGSLLLLAFSITRLVLGFGVA
jgi:hypothetical protein